MSKSPWSIFPPGKSSYLVYTYKCNEDEEPISITKLISRHLFCQTIQIVTQNAQLAQTIRNFVTETTELGFLLIKNMPVYALIDDRFLKSYLQNGKLYGLSVNRDVNVDDTIALLPNQKIILSLNYDSYYKLGIVGAKSILNKNKILTPKYRVEICLNKSYFKPEKKNYQRTYECLKRSQLAFDFIIKWDPTDSCISSNSLENYFNFLKENSPSDRLLSNMTIEKCVPTLRTFKNSSMPVLCSDDVESMTDDYLRDFIDWVGAQVAQVNCVDADYEISTFDFGDRPADSNIYCAELKGFFTSTNITKLRDILKPLLSSDEQNALIVHGFVDSPQCWTGTNNEHYKNISGENLYGIGRLNNQMAISWCLTDEYDFGIEKL